MTAAVDLSKTINWGKTGSIIALLLATALLLGSRGDREIVVPHSPLQQFPLSLVSGWTGRLVTIDPQALEILGAGDFTERYYVKDSQGLPVDLFIAYFPSQRIGVGGIHSPKNCLPGSGWAPIESRYVPLNLAGGRSYEINEYIVQKGEQKELSLYWYQSHGRLVANEYIAKYYFITDSIRLNRTDGALVRIVTPIIGNESQANAELRALQFAQGLMPELAKYIPA
jgi:EpsI family protein